MDRHTLRASLTAASPPASLSVPLQALWLAAKGDWHGAHELLQPDESQDASWVHAYLHRDEGDVANAAYWYRRAGRPVSRQKLAAEWDSIAAALLEG